jgi:hypothetical protein
LKLRGELAGLHAAAAQRENDSTRSTAKSWLNREEQLRQYLEQHPDAKIPEFQFLTEKGWLSAVDPSSEMKDFKTTDEYFREAIESLKIRAEDRVGGLIQNSLQKYSDANNGQFPTDLSQLQPYCDPNVEVILEQFYEIKPASILPATQVKDFSIKTDWVVTRKKRVNVNSTSRTAFFASGCVSWQSTTGADDP